MLETEVHTKKMLGREKLCKQLEQKLRRITVHPQEIRDTSKEIKERFGMPEELSNDYLCLRKDIKYADDFTIFIFCSILKEKDISLYFSKQEINVYSKSKFEVDKLEFPLRLKMIQVAEDQWVGKITAKDIIKLRDAQVINYNSKAQRTMRRIVAGEEVRFRIALNEKAVRGIEQSFSNQTYIPNTITLNMPEGIQYYYDEEKNELVINGSEDFRFDILDGYHRYVAISMEKNVNDKFDYPMELRIVQFKLDKARQFIWQEDQKTKMKRIDSDAMNQSSIATKVINRLNMDSTFDLQGQVNPNDGIINSGVLHQCITSIYSLKPGYDRAEEMEAIREITNRFRYVINELTFEDPNTYLKKRWSRDRIIAVSYVCSRYYTPSDDFRKAVEEVRKIIKDNPDLFSKIVSETNKLLGTSFKKIDVILAERNQSV